LTRQSSVGLVWFRRDLRLDDNPAWAAATLEREVVAPVFVLDPRLFERAGFFRRRQLIANLTALDDDLRDRGGGRLLVRVGDPAALIPSLVRELRAGAAYWNSDVSPFAKRRDRAVTERLGIPSRTFTGSLVHAPRRVLTRAGTLSRVFTPFFRVWEKTEIEPWPEPGGAAVLDHPGDSLPVLDGEPPVPGGESEARRRLHRFLDVVDRYGEDRDRPDVVGTSMLSVDLKYGTLSPRTVLDVVGTGSRGREAFVRQLAWRDWYAHLLDEVPTLASRPLKPRYATLDWRNDPDELTAWKEGRTGYPIIDAGMRQLRETGWMHNRVRMLCGSFLVKNLLVDWRIGEKHFRHLLVDADTSQNAGNWQWVAGTGPDASPYNRIFNPVLQSQKFDPTGAYIRRWVPELASLGTDHIHEPWLAPPFDLAAAGVVLGADYPPPIVDLRESRSQALAAYAAAGESESGEADSSSLA
jgi:deoxyribodipyrimidine photo-lyase